MRQLATIGLISLLAACGGGSGSSTGTSNPSITRNYSFFDTSTNFATAVTRSATVTINGASTSVVFTNPAVTISTIDNWNTNTWTGTAGAFNAEKADGNVLRICNPATAAGTTMALSQNLTELSAGTATARSVLANKVFALEDCTGSLGRTYTFDSTGASFTSSSGPTTVTQAAVDAMFSTNGFTDTSVTPNETTRMKIYSMTMGSATGYFMVILNTNGTTNKVIQGIRQ